MDALQTVARRPALPEGREKLQYPVEISLWIRWGFILASPAIALGILLVEGSDSWSSWLILTGILAAVAAFSAILDMSQTYLIVHSERVEMRSGLHSTKHRIPYSVIVNVTATETGWLTIVYTKPAQFLMKERGTSAAIRLGKHASAAEVAQIVKSGVDESRRGVGGS